VSKAQLVITAVILEGRTQADVARAYGVSKSSVSKLVARYQQHGEAAFTPRSRHPHHSPQRLPDGLIERRDHPRRLTLDDQPTGAPKRTQTQNETDQTIGSVRFRSPERSQWWVV
jgi:transposase-like protein